VAIVAYAIAGGALRIEKKQKKPKLRKGHALSADTVAHGFAIRPVITSSPVTG
jgi:hypothetical protein